MAKPKIAPGYLFLLLILTVVCLSMLYPFINLLFISVSDIGAVMRSKGLMLYPVSVHFSAYSYLLQYPNLTTSYFNTVFITLVGTTLALIMSTLGAHVLARRDIPGRGLLTTFIVITMFFGGGLIPTYLNMRSLHLINTRWVLILPFIISTWNMLLLRNFMMGIPVELNEAARIDGCGEFRLLLQIIVPLSLPILATLALFYGVSRWNEYTNVIIYNSRANLQTIQVVIRQMYESAANDAYIISAEGKTVPLMTLVQAATVIFATIPILCVYPFLQKHFAKGLMVGSVKG